MWFGDKLFSGTPLTTFRDATELEIRNIIAELVPRITDIVNMSLRDTLIPKSRKTALIRPLLKKTGLDSNILEKNCPRI